MSYKTPDMVRLALRDVIYSQLTNDKSNSQASKRFVCVCVFFPGSTLLIDVDTLWWTNIAMENHHAINGKIHYFDWAIFNS